MYKGASKKASHFAMSISAVKFIRCEIYFLMFLDPTACQKFIEERSDIKGE